jgi:thiamine biosynthesis lipoprotein
MGVSTRIVVEAPEREAALEAAAAAFERIGEIEQVASDYRPSSELMRLCREATVGEWRPVSRDLAVLLSESRRVSERTGGAFDATVGPVVGLWREARRSERLADAAVLKEARGRIDWRAVEVEADPPRVRLMKARMALDLGGIAKGYAAREAGRVLESRGLKRCLVALAGDVYAGEAPSGADGWRVEVQGDRGEGVVGTVLVEHACVSTSGDTEQFVEIGGVRYSHIIDPRTGVGTPGGLIVTAIGEDGAYVDAADTGAVVMGQAGLRRAFAGDRRVTLIVHGANGKPEIVGDPRRVRWAEPGKSE